MLFWLRPTGSEMRRETGWGALPGRAPGEVGGRAGVRFRTGFGIAFPSWGRSSELGLLTLGFGGLRAW